MDHAFFGEGYAEVAKDTHKKKILKNQFSRLAVDGLHFSGDSDNTGSNGDLHLLLALHACRRSTEFLGKIRRCLCCSRGTTSWYVMLCCSQILRSSGSNTTTYWPGLAGNLNWELSMRFKRLWLAPNPLTFAQQTRPTWTVIKWYSVPELPCAAVRHGWLHPKHNMCQTSSNIPCLILFDINAHNFFNWTNCGG